jgi:hypothetical protein
LKCVKRFFLLAHLLPHYVPVHAYHPTPKVPIGKRKKEKLVVFATKENAHRSLTAVNDCLD